MTVALLASVKGQISRNKLRKKDCFSSYIFITNICASTGFWWGNLRERVHLQDPGVEGWMILNWVLRKGDGGTNWIGLA
jgi:hypothetical protein